MTINKEMKKEMLKQIEKQTSDLATIFLELRRKDVSEVILDKTHKAYVAVADLRDLLEDI